MKSGVNPSFNNYEIPNITYCAKKNDINGVAQALQRDVKCINEQDHAGLTALHWAASNRNTKLVDFLLTYLPFGLDVHVQDIKGRRAMDHAIDSGADTIVSKLTPMMYPETDED